MHKHKKSKFANQVLAGVMAIIMSATSFPITAFADGFDLSSAPSNGSSAIIDDPISGETGSGWDNIGGGGAVRCGLRARRRFLC